MKTYWPAPLLAVGAVPSEKTHPTTVFYETSIVDHAIAVMGAGCCAVVPDFDVATQVLRRLGCTEAFITDQIEYAKHGTGPALSSV